jgi:hypothetical protein
METKDLIMSGIFANRMDRTTWRAGWREIGGAKKYYRSRWEANYARYLEYKKERGEIVGWAHEPTTFWFEGIKRGVNNYLPDFQVHMNGENGIVEEYHEVKGWMDSKSATKIKRMEKYYPNVKLVVIDRTLYKTLEKEFASVIEGWELLTKREKSEVPEGSEHAVENASVKERRAAKRQSRKKKAEQELL